MGSACRLPGPAGWRRRRAGGREAGGCERSPGRTYAPAPGIDRLARRAEQARGPGRGAPTLEQPELEEEEEERRRGRRRRRGTSCSAARAWGAWRRGRCCWRSCGWVSARGFGGARGTGAGGARLRRAAWGAQGARGGSLETRPGRGAAAGRPGARWAAVGPARGAAAVGRASPHLARGVARGRQAPCPLYLLAAGSPAHLELAARKVPAVPARFPDSRTETRVLDVPAMGATGAAPRTVADPR